MTRVIINIIHHNIISYLIIGFVISGCKAYVPQLTAIPLMTEKNEFQVEAGINPSNSCKATITYAPLNNISLQVAGSILLNNFYGSKSNGTRDYYHLSIGYFHNIKDSLVFEIYTGFGQCNFKTYELLHEEGSGPAFFQGIYNTYFIQLNYGKSKRYGFGFRISNIDVNYNYIDEVPNFNESTNHLDNYLSLEPIFFCGLGGKKNYYKFQIGICQLLRLTDNLPKIPFGVINFGFSYTFGIKGKIKN